MDRMASKAHDRNGGAANKSTHIVARQGAKAAEELGLWALKLPPVEVTQMQLQVSDHRGATGGWGYELMCFTLQEALGRQRKQQILDGYYQATQFNRIHIISYQLSQHALAGNTTRMSGSGTLVAAARPKT